MARITFNSVFTQYPDGTLEPIRRTRIGGVEFGPGVRFSKGVAFAGIDLSLFIGRDLEVREENGILIIEGIYQ
ncbi:MAG: hypothetical protein UW22_C0003G0003 [Candidatus Gottesmanbacteria bacterium GW2011_GWB1_44_11c]|uniref:Uncharacterized protein n=1 Tax=Candidatus Gottesmanbacteria bacterium GW2011_GWB1_44_11c TaxID=1618447 RepID=A0A0G1GV34_9BACT|nr:MAG: hypothetical protein UW22_C0003G0003 [Candidatus Gottesmanbacteria bacterium GW2011_GWB1_44_11c]